MVKIIKLVEISSYYRDASGCIDETEGVLDLTRGPRTSLCLALLAKVLPNRPGDLLQELGKQVEMWQGLIWERIMTQFTMKTSH